MARRGRGRRGRYRALDEPLLHERAADVLDVGRRVVGRAHAANRPRTRPARTGIVVADELTPADAAALDPELVHRDRDRPRLATAHAAILARALGLPAVVGLGDAVLGDRGRHDRCCSTARRAP